MEDTQPIKETWALEDRPRDIVRVGGRFAPGSRTGGKAPGTRNRLPGPQETAMRMGVDPVEIMLHIAKHGTILEPDGKETPVDPEERMRMVREVAPFIHSKAPVQTTSTEDHRHIHVDVSRIMQDPALAEAAERLALSLLDETPVIEGHAEAVFDAE